MKIAFSFWNGRIAPVFDVARQILLVEIDAGRVVREREEELPADSPAGKAEKLAGLGVNTLVCGAVSRFLHELILSKGIAVTPFIAGDLREVIRAWEGHRLNTAFAMPGCCGRTRRRTGCTAGPARLDLYTCPGCGLQRRYGEHVQGLERICPGCGSIMLRGQG